LDGKLQSMLEDDDDVPPLNPKRVALFGAFLALIVLGGWYIWRTQSAIKEVAEASKDYRKLFPARTEATTAPAPKPVPANAPPVSGIGLLKIDDDMRAPKRVPAAARAPETQPEPPPVAAVQAEPAAPASPVKKSFARPNLNSGAFSGLNGGAGVGFSGGNSAAAAPPPSTDGK